MIPLMRKKRNRKHKFQCGLFFNDCGANFRLKTVQLVSAGVNDERLAGSATLGRRKGETRIRWQ
jgi:hypothetical protein